MLAEYVPRGFRDFYLGPFNLMLDVFLTIGYFTIGFNLNSGRIFLTRWVFAVSKIGPVFFKGSINVERVCILIFGSNTT